MPSLYLQPPELGLYNVASATPAQIQTASQVIDGFLGRPEGLVWMPDYQGAPCWMAAATPQLIYTAQGPIAAGSNVVVPVKPVLKGIDQVGRVVVLDRVVPAIAETAVITAYDLVGGTITLDTVVNPHNSGALLEYGLVIQEERALPDDRPMTRTSRWPLARLVALQGRYAFQRRSEQAAGYHFDFNLLSTIATFGGPPLWLAVDPANTGMEESTGELWPPAGPYIASYSEVRIHYIAGWAQNALPGPIKQACANILLALAESPTVSGNVKRAQAGGSAFERFAAGFLDDDTKTMLMPYRLRRYI